MTSTPVDSRPAAVGSGRRKAAAICLVLAPFATMTEMAAWPVGSDGSTAAQLQAAATAPTAYTVAWLAESLGAVLTVVGLIGLLGFLRGRGRTLALVGGILVGGGQTGVLTGGGFNAAIVPLAQQPERDVAVRVLDTFNSQSVLPLFAALIWLGLLGLVLVFVAAVRGRLVRWWVLVLIAAAIVTVPLLDNDRYGLSAAATALPLAAAEVLLGVSLFRARPVPAQTGAATQAATPATEPEAALG